MLQNLDAVTCEAYITPQVIRSKLTIPCNEFGEQIYMSYRPGMGMESSLDSFTTGGNMLRSNIFQLSAAWDNFALS